MNFQQQLFVGGLFEDAVEPLIASYFYNLDPMSTYIPTATSKIDSQHNRGQRLKYCQDPSASYMLPDFFVFSNNLKTCIEVKYKNNYVSRNGKLYVVIDKYKTRDYRDACKSMGFDQLMYVFGSSDGLVYIAHDTPGSMIINNPPYTSYKNPRGEFDAWDISELLCIGKVDLA